MRALTAKATAIAFWALSALSAGTQVSAAMAERIVRSKVSGVDVVIYPMGVQDVVTIAGNLPAGDAYAVRGNILAATATGILIEKGTTKQDKFAIAQQLDDVGAQVRFSVSDQMLSVNAKSLKTDLPLVIQLIAEQLRTPSLSEEEFAKTKTQLEGSILQSLEDPEARAKEAFGQSVFPVGHPNRPSRLQERLAALKQLTLDDVKAFHRKYYGPANLTLVFVGDVDSQAIQAEVQKAFAGWTGGVEANRSANAAKARSTPEQSIVLQDKASVAVVLGQATGLRYQDTDSLALRVGTAILGSGFTGRLMASVRDAEGLTYGIEARASDDTFLDGDVAVSATFAPQLLAKGITSTRREIGKWWQDGVTAQELTARKTNMIGAYEVGLATTGGVARTILETLNRGKNLTWLDEYPKALQALTLAQVNGAIRKYLDPEKMVLVKAGTLP